MKKLLKKIKLKFKEWWKRNIVDEVPPHLEDLY